MGVQGVFSMNDQYKNSYKATAKELVSLSVYNVGYQLCDAGYQWGPGIRDHYLIHYIISGKGTYEVHHEVHSLSAGDAFLVYPNTEVIYRADAKKPMGIRLGRFYRKRRCHHPAGN